MAWTIGAILSQWESFGIFQYVLPFLLVFALIYAILEKSQLLGTNKGVWGMVAAAVGLISLYGGYLPRFLQNLAPNLAVGISVLLAAIILLGLFAGNTETKWVNNVIVAIGIVSLVFVIINSFQEGSVWNSGLFIDQYLPSLLILAIIIFAVVAIVKTKKP